MARKKLTNIQKAVKAARKVADKEANAAKANISALEFQTEVHQRAQGLAGTSLSKVTSQLESAQQQLTSTHE
jgi:hypothetical protein